jgi:hypothetical protein
MLRARARRRVPTDIQARLEQVIEGLVGTGAPEAADRDDDSDVR